MAKYKIVWGEIKKVTVGGVEKELYEGEFSTMEGTKFNATVWRMDKEGKEFPNWSEIRPGGELEGKPWKKPGTDKTTIYPPDPEKTPSGGYRRSQKPSLEETKELMNIKKENIHQAQDRTAWMWAKNNASELIAHHPVFKNDDSNQLDIAKQVLNLATKIYNGEPVGGVDKELGF